MKTPFLHGESQLLTSSGELSDKTGHCELVMRYVSNIMKTYLYNFDPLKPHFYIVKLEFTGVYFILLISAKKHRLWVLVRTASARRF